MKIHKVWTATLAVAALIVSPAGAEAQGKANPAAYGALPDVSAIRISPDGKTLAFLQRIDGEHYVVFRSIDDPGARPTGVKIGEADARQIEWADNEHLLLQYSQSEQEDLSSGLRTIEYFRWVSVSKTTQKAIVLFGNEANYVISDPGKFLAMIPGKKSQALFSRTSPRGNYNPNIRATRIPQKSDISYSTFSVDLDSGKTQLLDTGAENTEDWVANNRGEAFIRVDYDGTTQQREIFVRRDGQGDFALLKPFDEKGGAGSSVTVHGLVNGGTAVAASIYGGGDKRALVALDLQSGEIGQALFSNTDFDIDRVIYDPRTAEAIGVEYIDDLPRVYHFNADDRALQQQLRNAVQGAAPMIVSKSADGQRMIVEAIYADHPKQFYKFDRSSKRLEMISPSYAALDGTVVAQKEKFDYRAPDGKMIPGYITAPVGADKKSMPLIVLPHGGPESRADQSFDYWSFFYAASGYLVYEPNFRGSDGYGFGFKSAGYGEWGRKMQDDITAGVRKLIDDGAADPNRICIAGASYGGYAALAGATLTPDIYRCAVSVNGVSDLVAMLAEQSRNSSLAENYWEVRMGGSRFSQSELDAVSPAKLARNAGVPILLIHAKDDTIVPIGQSRAMRDALKRADKPHEYVELQGEDHWLSTGEMRTEMLRRSIEFIDRHIGAKAN